MDELKQILENAGMSEGAGGPHHINPMRGNYRLQITGKANNVSIMHEAGGPEQTLITMSKQTWEQLVREWEEGIKQTPNDPEAARVAKGRYGSWHPDDPADENWD
jgi:hypothetical protein